MNQENLLVPMSLIDPNPYNPRTVFHEESLNELKESITVHGLIHKPVARFIEGRYQLAVGHRRWKAATELQWPELPLEIREYTDHQMALIAITENLQRANVSPLDDARAYRTLMDKFGMKQQDVAEQLGVSQPKIAQMLSLLKLIDPMKELVDKGELSPSVARTIAPLEPKYQELVLTDKLTEVTAKEIQKHVSYINKMLKLMEFGEIEEKDTLEQKFIKFMASRDMVDDIGTIKENEQYIRYGSEVKYIGLSYSIREQLPRKPRYMRLTEYIRGNVSYGGQAYLVLKKSSKMTELLEEYISMFKIPDKVLVDPVEVSSNPANGQVAAAEKPRESKEERERKKEEARQNSPIGVRPRYL